MQTEELAILNNSLGTIVVKNKTLLVAQPKRSDIFSFWRYCRDLAKQSQSIKEKVAELDGLPEDVRKPLINVLILENKGEPTPSMVWEFMASPKGIAFLTFLLTREHNKVTLDELNALITHENVDKVIVDLEDASGMRVITENLKTDVKINVNPIIPQDC